MFKKIKYMFSEKELRNKMLFTLGMIAIFILGGFIPIPFVSKDVFKTLANSYTIFGLYDILSGGNFGNFTIFSMSITPYISANIIVTLLAVIFPRLKELSEEGTEGKRKFKIINIASGLGLALIQALILVLTQQTMLEPYNFWTGALCVLILVAGVGALIAISELIDKFGIGNGTSIIIFIGIVSGIPATFLTIWAYLTSGLINIWELIGIIALFVICLIGIVMINDAEKKVPIKGSGKVVGKQVYMSKTSFLPIKPNMSGVIPVIFASTIVLLPNTIAQFLPGTGYADFINTYFAWGGLASTILYILFIFCFSFYYTSITFNTYEIASDLRKNGTIIPGVRPGKPTDDYLKRIVKKLTFFGALFLCLIALIPNLTFSLMGITLGFSGTSFIILVSVALDVYKEIAVDVKMHEMHGFLK